MTESATSLVVLGSTGSIGTQALDVVAKAGGFSVTGLAAGGGDVALLAEQVRAHRVPRVAVADPPAAAALRPGAPGAAALRQACPGVEVLDGPQAATDLVTAAGADVVLNGVTGSRGLGPTLA